MTASVAAAAAFRTVTTATARRTATGAGRSVRRFARRHPVTAAGLAAGGCTLSYAVYVERRTERRVVAALALEESSSAGDANDDRPDSVPADADPGAATASLPRKYDRASIEQFWTDRPITVLSRLVHIVTELTPLILSVVKDSKLTCELSDPTTGDALLGYHAARLRRALTNLGPAFVKAGQQLSIRPDLVPPAVLAELSKLCDSVEPVPDVVAFDVMKEELMRSVAHVAKKNGSGSGSGGGDDGSSSAVSDGDGDGRGGDPIDELFDGVHLVASASLGQVYKARFKGTNTNVAIKVQRPEMVRKVSLDLFLLDKVAWLADLFTTTFTEQAPYHVGLVDTFARGSYMELDYENEASNQNYFRTELSKRKCPVHIPLVYSDYTTRRVLTTEWVDGVKLADAPREQIRELIPVGVELFLTQLLDVGAFHADPHPGNLYVTNQGGANAKLCLLDFGLCAEVDERSRAAMTAAIVSLLARDYDSLISRHAKALGFLPDDLDTRELQPVLTKILSSGMESGSDLKVRGRKLMEISNELNEVFFRYPFTVPPFFALVTRGLGLLEGIALSGDPTFDIFQASYPYARRRAVELFGAHGMNQVRQRWWTGKGGDSHTVI